MMQFIKAMLLVFVTGTFASQAYAIEKVPGSGPGAGMGPGQGMGGGMGPGAGMGPGKAFKRHLGHANFMPNLMPRLMGSYKRGNPLALTKEQYDKLMDFHTKNVGKMRGMVEKVIQLEREARKMALAGEDDKAIIKVGEESIKLRSNIMHGKLKCRAFVRSVLTKEQFETLAKNYYHPKKMMKP